jgi:hypothetical protein
MIASVIACAFVSRVSMAAIVLAATPPTPFSVSHFCEIQEQQGLQLAQADIDMVGVVGSSPLCWAV